MMSPAGVESAYGAQGSTESESGALDSSAVVMLNALLQD